MSTREIYVGVWTNWSEYTSPQQNGPRLLIESLGLGAVPGLTLTVPSSYGVILIALLAMIVRWAGSRFWGIICFVLHRIQTNQMSHDGLHFQHQALLRSKSSETDFVWRIYEIGWAWRSIVPSSFRRSVPFAVLAIVNLAIFLVAGIFSGSVTLSESQGLAVGKCGWLEESANKDFSLWTQNDWDAGDVLFVSAYNGYKGSMTYSQNCYARDLLNASDITCKEAVIPFIKSTTRNNDPCPFAQGVCAGPAFTIDSGPISSDHHLGINTPPSSRVTVRKATSCAPIDMDAFSKPWTPSPEPGTEMFLPIGVPNDNYRYYFVGPSIYSGYTVSNFTFVMSNYSLFVNGLPYTFNTRTSYAKNFTEGGFLPVAALNRTDADVTIFTLNNRVAYTGEVFDPLYRANRQAVGNGLADAWVSNSTLTGLACTEQYQFCNPSLSDPSARCTPMGSMVSNSITSMNHSRTPPVL